MTPKEARALLDGTTPGPWEWCEGKDQNGEFVALCGPDGADALRTWDGDLYASGVHGTDADKALAAAAPALAEMVAGMREEWGVAVTYPGLAEVVEWGYSTQAGALEEVELASTAFSAEYRIVRRYVTEPEEIS